MFDIADEVFYLLMLKVITIHITSFSWDADDVSSYPMKLYVFKLEVYPPHVLHRIFNFRDMLCNKTSKNKFSQSASSCVYFPLNPSIKPVISGGLTLPDDLMPLMMHAQTTIHARRRHKVKSHLISPGSSTAGLISNTFRLEIKMLSYKCMKLHVSCLVFKFARVRQDVDNKL